MAWKLLNYRSCPNLVRSLIQCVHLNIRKSWFQLLSAQSTNDNDLIDLCKNMLSCPVYFLCFCNNLYVNGKYIIIEYIHHIMHHNRTSFFSRKACSIASSVKHTVYETIVHSNRSKPIQHLPIIFTFCFVISFITCKATCASYYYLGKRQTKFFRPIETIFRLYICSKFS